jgi:methionyl aminopeptidase
VVRTATLDRGCVARAADGTSCGELGVAIPIKSPGQVESMAQAGRTLDAILAELVTCARPGVRSRDLNMTASALAGTFGVKPMLEGYTHPPPNSGGPAFPGAVCVSVNEEVTHAVPSSRVLRMGDVATIDMAIRAGEWCVDAATTVVVGGGDSGDISHESRAARMQRLAREMLDEAIDGCVAGATWASVVERVRAIASRASCSLMDCYSGHGIGVHMHEPPRLGWGADVTTSELVLRPGMVLCIEPIVSEMSIAPECVTLHDGWTVLTQDRSWTACEEACVAITHDGDGPRLLAGARWRR